MVIVQQLNAPISFPTAAAFENQLSVFSYNVLLPNSQDGWWTYKMYLPPLTDERKEIANWNFRSDLIKERIKIVDADVVCLQEVSPVSFDEDFTFMQELGYDGKEMFKRGRFRPATFWKMDRLELIAPPVHKDRTLLTAFRRKEAEQQTNDKNSNKSSNWYVLNCHLQAGKQAPRRVRQINDGVRSVLTLARKLKEKNPERNVPLIVCGDFNGGPESGAVRYLEDGSVDKSFCEDGEPVTSSRKALPLEHPMKDVVTLIDRTPPPTLVVAELISLLVEGEAYDNPKLSKDAVERLERIYNRLATHKDSDGNPVMNVDDVERYLISINGQVGRGSEFREAARQMGWKDDTVSEKGSSSGEEENEKPRITLPIDGILTFDGFRNVYQAELRQGKFWGIAYDLAVLGEPLTDAGVFEARYDRMYCSSAVQPTAVMDFLCTLPCPNEQEPSDHLPVAASFQLI